MSGALRAQAGALRESVHAEWTKLRTVPSTGWLLLTMIVLIAGVGALATEVVKCPATCSQDTTKLSLTGIQLGQAAVAVLAVLAVSGEYSSGMIRITLTAMPRRLTALAAKAIVLAGVVLAAGAIATAGSVLAGSSCPATDSPAHTTPRYCRWPPGPRCARQPARCCTWP